MNRIVSDPQLNSDAARPVILLKRILLGFWAAWLSIVLLSNLADAGNEWGLLHGSWSFKSGNFLAITETTARYGTSDMTCRILFAGVILWEGIAAVLFWRAVALYRDRITGRPALYTAFTISLGLWGAFVLADEICIAYAFEGAHLRLFTAQLVTLLAIELLPENLEAANANRI